MLDNCIVPFSNDDFQTCEVLAAFRVPIRDSVETVDGDKPSSYNLLHVHVQCNHKSVSHAVSRESEAREIRYR